MNTPLSWTQGRRHYWMLPHFVNGPGGGNLILGPVQFNWYNRGFRIHLTWPVTKTFSLIESH